jgi:hypothetical protein
MDVTRGKITPYSPLVCIILFVPAVFIVHHAALLVLQTVVLGGMILLGKVDTKELRLGQSLHLLPVIAFILLLNAFGGGGEVMIRLGPVIILKQGVMRGVYVSAFILELFVMSRVLTASSSRTALLSVFTRIAGRGGVLMVLYHILVIFKHTYSEIRVFIPRVRRHAKRREGEEGDFDSSRGGLRDRLVLFFERVFDRSLQVYQADWRVVPVRVTVGDGVVMVIQTAAIAGAFFMRGMRI